MHSIKSFTAHEINKAEGKSGIVWEKESMDRMIRSDADLSEKFHDICANPWQAGVAGPGERESGSWRYPVRTSRITVVVAFRSESVFVVVTAWRHQRRLGSGR